MLVLAVLLSSTKCFRIELQGNNFKVIISILHKDFGLSFQYKYEGCSFLIINQWKTKTLAKLKHLWISF